MAFDFKYFTRNNESPNGKFLIYVSYSHVDGRGFAFSAAQRLVDEFDCAVVLNEAPYERPVYENNENKHLAAANLMVFIATQKAVMSESVRVNDISYARSLNIPIVSLQPDAVNPSRLSNLTGSPYSIKMNSNRYEELFRKIFATLIVPPAEIEILKGFKEDLNSVLDTAQCYAAGRTYYLKKDLRSAYRWLNMAADKGGSKTGLLACHMIGIMNYVGLCSSRGFADSIAWFTRSSALPESSFMLGYMSECGEGKAVNYPSAVRSYLYAAERGDSDAQYILGFIFYQGSGVKKDRDLAVKWYTKAAQNGNAKAQYVLAVLYDIGNDVEQNHALASELYLKAARQGHKGAAAALSDRRNSNTNTTPSYEKKPERRESPKNENSIAPLIFMILSLFPGLIVFSFPFSLIGSFVSFFKKKKTYFYINLIFTSISFVSIICTIIYMLLR